jgi:BASS family bile acid:Na+ symporter
MDHATLLALTKITIFLIGLDIGINLSIEKLIVLWRRPGWLIRTFLAVVVLVPLVVILLLKIFALSQDVSTGLALLAASPGAPVIAKRAQMVGARLFHGAGLQLTLALAAVIVTPITLQIFNNLFVLTSEKVTALEVSRQIFMVQLLPVTLGLALQKYALNVALKIGKPLNYISNGLFLLLVIVLLIPAGRLMLQMGILPIAVMILMASIALAIGHVVGGASLERHSALAIASVARNIGLALFLAILNNVEREIFPTLASYALVGSLVAIPYSIWNKRQMAAFSHRT